MKKQAGQTLLEILLAFSISILVLGAAIFVITTSLNNTQYTKNQNLANSYAQEGMAMIRQMRESSWSNFHSKTDVNYCLSQDLSTLASDDGRECAVNGLVGIFARSIKLKHNSTDCANGGLNGSRVLVTVSWPDNKCPVGTPYCHKVELITCFSTIDPTPAP